MGNQIASSITMEEKVLQEQLENVIKEREQKALKDEENSEEKSELDFELSFDGEYTELKFNYNKTILKWKIARLESKLGLKQQKVKASLERFEVRIDKIYGLTVSDDGLKFTVWALGRKDDGLNNVKVATVSNFINDTMNNVKKTFTATNKEWFQNQYTFEAKTVQQASAWLDVLAQVTELEWEERDALLILNEKDELKSLEILNEVKPMFNAANIVLHIEKSKNIQEKIYSTTRLCELNHLVVLGDDKSFHDAVNGILTRPDFDRVTKRVVISAVPTGKFYKFKGLEFGNNAVSKFLGVSHPYLSVLTAIRGKAQPFDVMSVTSSTGFRMFSHLNLHWGLIADIQMDSVTSSDKGNVGLNWNTFYHCLFPRAFEGTLHFLPVSNEEAIEEGLKPPIPVSVTAAERLAKPGPRDHLDNFDVENLPEGWKTVRAAFSLFFATNVSFLTPSLIGAPLAITSDGAVDLAYTQTGFWNFMKWILLPSYGYHLSSKYWNFNRAKAFLLEPGKDLNGKDGFLTVDGKKIPYTPIRCEVHKGALRVQTPMRKIESRAEKWNATLKKWGKILGKERKPMLTFEDYKFDAVLSWVYSFGILLLILAILWQI